MKRILRLLLAFVLVVGLAACGTAPGAESDSGSDAADVPMQYMSADEMNAVLGQDGYTVIDLRKVADYEAAHIPFAVNADLDAAVNGDTAAGEEAMKAVTQGMDDTLILVCYSGKRYAQAGTNALSAIGYDMTKVYTLEGGMQQWTEDYPDILATGGQDSSSSTRNAANVVGERTVYVAPEWLNSALNGNEKGYENVTVICVAYPEGAAEYADYAQGHIPGALYASNMEVEDATGSQEGAYNLLPAEEVRDNLLAHGIAADSKVVLYGPDVAGVARQAYAYIWCGVKDVKILNGGLDAWTGAGYELETKANTGSAATDFGVAVPAHPEYWVSMKDALNRLSNDENFKLVSIRAEAEWLGETSGYGYMDKAGEPEGAVWGRGSQSSADVADFLNADGTVMDLEGIMTVWEGCDFTLDNHLSFYCGTGWRAAVPFLVLYENGYDDISIYDGGWYEWIMHDENPVQVGDPAEAGCVHTTVGELRTGMAA